MSGLQTEDGSCQNQSYIHIRLSSPRALPKGTGRADLVVMEQSGALIQDLAIRKVLGVMMLLCTPAEADTYFVWILGAAVIAFILGIYAERYFADKYDRRRR